MEITRCGCPPSGKEPADSFTRTARIESAARRTRATVHASGAMKLFVATVTSLSPLAWAGAHANQTIKIARSGSQPSRQGPAENFTGSVRIDPLFNANEPSRASGALVTFEPGARTAWHTRPLGQTLIVTAGDGWVQQWGGQIQDIRQGDVVWIPPGQKHWHGATATRGMTHIAVQEHLEGKVVDWMEKVSDKQYGR
jgi:4-carboxymuconolactone decarboxylase